MAKACQRIDNEGIEGDIVECGVWRGGNIILARFYCPDRVCWLFDTFAGMANPSVWDFKRGGFRMNIGKAAVTVEDVTENLRTIMATGSARAKRWTNTSRATCSSNASTTRPSRR
jgi:hypothetical protein